MRTNNQRAAGIRALLREQSAQGAISPHESRGSILSFSSKRFSAARTSGADERGLTRGAEPSAITNARKKGELRRANQEAFEQRLQAEKEAYDRKDRMEREVLIRRRARADRYGTKGGTLLTGPQGIVGNLGGAPSFLGA